MKHLKVLFIFVIAFSLIGITVHATTTKKSQTTNSSMQKDSGQTPKPVVLKKPDLIISKVVIYTGYKLEVTIQNIGPQKSTPCMLELKLGCDGSTPRVEEHPIPALNADKNIPDVGCFYTLKIEHSNGYVPFDVSKVIFKIDSKNTVMEEKENNNIWFKDNCLK